MQMYYGEWPWPIIISEETHAFVLFIVLLSVVSFEIGWGWIHKNYNYSRGEYLILPKENMLYALFIVYAIIFAYFIARIGDLSLLLGARVNAYAETGGSSTTRLISDAIFRTPIVVLSLTLFSLYFSNLYHRFRFFWPLVIACLIMLTISNFPTAQARGRIGGIVIAFIVIWFIYRRPRLANWFPTIMAAGTLIVFPLLGQTRREVALDNLTWNSVRRAYFQGSFDAYQMLGAIVDYANVNGVSWGRQFLGALFFWVPRSIWPDKPIGTGARVATDLGLPFTNLSAPLWGEAYLNFGVVGVLIAFFILGWVLRMISTAFLNRGGMMMIFGSFFVGFQLFLLRGDLMSSFTFLVPFLIFAFILFYRASRVTLSIYPPQRLHALQYPH